MNAWLARFAPLITCLVLLAILWIQQGTVTAYKEAINGYKSVADQAAASARLAADAAAKVAVSTINLQTKQDELRAGLSAREIEIGALQNEVSEIRDWARTLLPTDIAGMRARPAITGADEYADYVSGRGTLHPAGRTPAMERRSESGDRAP
nr:LysB family phage lysis regulatory protein [Achromobacter sp. UMC71]